MNNIHHAKRMYQAGMSVEEIGEILKMPPSAVRNLLQAEIYNKIDIDCNHDGVPLDSTERTIARERGDESHIVVSRQREDSDTNPHPNDDEPVQSNTRGLSEDFDSLYEGVGGVLAESTEVDDPDAGLSGISDTNLDRLGLFALADAVRGLASAIRSATGVTVIPKGDG